MISEKSEETVIRGFDYRTHIRDPKTGVLTKVQTYKIDFEKNGSTIIERPIGSGKFFTPDGKEYIKPAKVIENKKKLEE